MTNEMGVSADYLITGHLTKESPMRAVFADGMIPLTRPRTTLAILGNDPTPQEVYFLALKQCSAEQLERMAEMMSEMGQGLKEEALAYLQHELEMPIRAHNLSGAGMSLRAFI